MIPHIHTLFEFISIPYENQHQTLNIKKIDRGQIKFRECSIKLLQPYFIPGHFQLKFRIKMCHENMQVKFEFGPG